jgi:hypothetical protein
MTKADEIRKYVVEHFAKVGTFKTRDVLTLTEQWPSSNVSSSLNDFANRSMLVDGYRLVKDGTRAAGSTQVWKLIPASEAASGESLRGSEFRGKILKVNDQTGTMIVTTEDDVYKVIPIGWS